MDSIARRFGIVARAAETARSIRPKKSLLDRQQAAEIVMRTVQICLCKSQSRVFASSTTRKVYFELRNGARSILYK